MTQPLRERWARRRQDGFWRFVLYDGAIGFGARAVVTTLIIQEWTGRVHLHGAHPVTLQALLWLLAGALWGACMWHTFESRYHRTTAAAPPATA